MMIRKLAFILLLCFSLTGCFRVNQRASTHHCVQNPIVTMTLDSEEKIIFELYPEKAPNTVNNFISLVEEEYYNGLIFHRIIEDYIVQSGDPLKNNYGTPGYTIEGEFKRNGIKNNLKHTKGVISMARSSQYDSAGSQFFITLEDANMLNGLYAGFGKVIEGMDIIETIGKLGGRELEEEDLPKIVTVTVDTKMAKYPEPRVIPIE